MKNHHEVGHFKNRLMIGLLSLFALTVLAGQSFAATSCSTCHGMPPLDSSDGSRIPSTGAFKGSHQAHLSDPAFPADCVSCHSDAAATYEMSHSATAVATTGKNVINLTVGIYSKGASDAFFNQTSVPSSPLGTCSNVSCHANVYSSGTGTSPAWGSTGNGCSACHSVPITATGPATGNHTNTPGHAVACITCHGAGTTATSAPTAGHIDTNIDTANVGYPADKAKGTAGATCSTASCHANPYGTGSVTTPAWGATLTNKCDACHTGANAITANGPATGSHTNTSGHAVACTTCHGTGTTATSSPTAGHLDNNIDVANVGYPADKAKGSAAASCSTASCHANPYGTGSVITPAWGATLTNKCDVCHTGANVITTNGPDTGSHTAHAGKACTSCHEAGTTATAVPSTGHNDTNIDVVNVTYPANIVKHAAGSGYGNCSNISCHSNGKFTAAAATWGGTLNCKGCHATLSAGHTPHISTLLDDRANTLVYDRYSANASSGGVYKFGCANCHPVTIANHLNNTVDVDLATTAGSGALKVKNPVSPVPTFNGSKQCLNVYCHSNGNTTTVYATTLVWGSINTDDKCAACHGNSPGASGQIAGSSAHNAHVVGIHYDDIFNGVSRKLPQGGGETVNAAHGRNNRSTTINCNVCHSATVTTSVNDKNFYCKGCHDGAEPPGTNKGTASIANTANHVNGKVDVSFIDSKVATKAQLTGSAFAGYTAANEGGWSRNSNGMPFKTYTSSYDVSKTTLFASASWNQSTGCANVACHSGKTVKWTDTISCQNCHTRLK